MMPGLGFKYKFPQTSISKVLWFSTSIHHSFNSSPTVMQLPNILREQTPVLVSLLRQSIEPHVLISWSNWRTLANSFDRRNFTPTNCPPAPTFSESEPLPLLSDVIALPMRRPKPFLRTESRVRRLQHDWWVSGGMILVPEIRIRCLG